MSENDEEIKVVIRTGTSINPPITRMRSGYDYFFEFEFVFQPDIEENKTDLLLNLPCKKIENETEINCVICLNKINSQDNVSILPKCNHSFHYDCLFEWVKVKGECPLCRLKIN